MSPERRIWIRECHVPGWEVPSPGGKFRPRVGDWWAGGLPAFLAGHCSTDSYSIRRSLISMYIGSLITSCSKASS
ncbi:hypothetical protein Mal15_38420 [Stieleria maiorica]|uniref:Uncharacterized protein n=1 Tax=Stieleria maiorica TaxID=2795974 RepID=A0A5B9MJJ3_9BACT|nr:hypothetical protein Mal15_38420 [Stieleria maiorica]